MFKSLIKILLVSTGLTIINSFNFVKAQEYSGCFILDSQGNYIDLTYSVCGVTDNNNNDLPVISEPTQEENLFVVTNTNIKKKVDNMRLIVDFISISIKNQTGLAFQNATLNYNLVKLYKNNNGLVYKKEPLYTGSISNYSVITPDQEVVFRDDDIISDKIPAVSDMVVEVINIELIDEYGEKLYHQF